MPVLLSSCSVWAFVIVKIIFTILWAVATFAESFVATFYAILK